LFTKRNVNKLSFANKFSRLEPKERVATNTISNNLFIFLIFTPYEQQKAVKITEVIPRTTRLSV